MKKIRIGVLVIILLTLSVLLFLLYGKHQTRKRANEQIRTLNQLPIVNLDSTRFDYSNLRKGKYIIVLYYNSDCNQCIGQLVELVENEEIIRQTVFLFISYENIAAIKSVSKKFRTDAEIYFSKIDQDDVFISFGSTVTPQLLIYNNEAQLIKEFKGAVKASLIIQYLH